MSDLLVKALIENLTETQKKHYFQTTTNVFDYYEDVQEDGEALFFGAEKCICGQKLLYLFSLRNWDSLKRYTIGSTCILRYGNDEAKEFMKKYMKEKKIKNIKIKKFTDKINFKIKKENFVAFAMYIKFLKFTRKIIKCIANGSFEQNDFENYGVINIMPLEMQLEIKEKIKSSQRKIEYPTSNQMQLKYIMKPLGFHLNEM